MRPRRSGPHGYPAPRMPAWPAQPREPAGGRDRPRPAISTGVAASWPPIGHLAPGRYPAPLSPYRALTFRLRFPLTSEGLTEVHSARRERRQPSAFSDQPGGVAALG